MSDSSIRRASGRSTFEKRGGYAPKGQPLARLPKVTPGPAPGAKPKKKSD